MSIVDVTNPNAPVEVAMIPGPLNDWKEIKTWGAMPMLLQKAVAAYRLLI
jgi:hypothetical protein